MLGSIVFVYWCFKVTIVSELDQFSLLVACINTISRSIENDTKRRKTMVIVPDRSVGMATLLLTFSFYCLSVSCLLSYTLAK